MDRSDRVSDGIYIYVPITYESAVYQVNYSTQLLYSSFKLMWLHVTLNDSMYLINGTCLSSSYRAQLSLIYLLIFEVNLMMLNIVYNVLTFVTQSLRGFMLQ
jgi:hypothetical protein